MSQRSCPPRNFSDELYFVFRLKRTTALKENELLTTFEKQYNRLFDTKLLQKIPFIQIQKDASHIEKNIYYLIVELDDCCKEQTELIECKTKDCPLLHLTNPNHHFNIIYPQFTGLNDSAIKKARAKTSPLQLPTLCLQQRLENILNKSTSNPKQMTFNQMQRLHNKEYPQFKFHQPTLNGIYIRFPNTFMVRNNETYNHGKSLILFNQILPDQTNKYYVSVSISSEWIDQSLLTHLIKHIKQKINIQIFDAYIKNMQCRGYFTTPNKSVVNALLSQTKHPKYLLCRGRKVIASLMQNQYKNGYRIKVNNLPSTFTLNEFKDWIYNVTNTVNRTDLLYDIIITFSKRNIGSSQCILVLNNAKDTQYIIKQGVMSFRGFPLQFTQWKHPLVIYNQDLESPLKEINDNKNDNNNKFKDIVGTITKQTVTKSLFVLEYTINNEIKSEKQIENIICLILENAIKNNKFIDEYVKLITYLPEYCVTVGYDKQCIHKMIVDQTYLLFSTSKDNKHCNKNNFCSVMQLIGELYNVGLFTKNLIYKGVLKHLLPKQNGKISKTNIEGLCELFMKCGKGLINEDEILMDKYLQKLIITKHKMNNNDRINQLIDNVLKLRDNEWLKNAEMEIYKTFEYKYREILSKQQIEMKQLMNDYCWMKESEVLKGKYNELKWDTEPSMRMNILTNQYKVLEIKYNQLLKQNMEHNYIEWNGNDVVDFIINLNKSEYSKYEICLRENMINEGINGKCLAEIDKNDLHRLGVTGFMDKCAIFNSIQELVNQ